MSASEGELPSQESSSEGTETAEDATTMDSATTSDATMDVKSDNCTTVIVEHSRLETKIASLITDREKMKSTIAMTEKLIFNLEKELLNTNTLIKEINKEVPYCEHCKLIKDPRIMKKHILQEIYGNVLRDKPRNIMCAFGLFKHLDDLIGRGQMDMSVVQHETKRCPRCRQVTDRDTASFLILSDTIEVLAALKKQQAEEKVEGCSGAHACFECLSYIEFYLVAAAAKLEPVKETPKVVVTPQQGEGARDESKQLKRTYSDWWKR